MGGGSRLENDDPEKKEDVENDEGDTGVDGKEQVECNLSLQFPDSLLQAQGSVCCVSLLSVSPILFYHPPTHTARARLSCGQLWAVTHCQVIRTTHKHKNITLALLWEAFTTTYEVILKPCNFPSNKLTFYIQTNYYRVSRKSV